MKICNSRRESLKTKIKNDKKRKGRKTVKSRKNILHQHGPRTPKIIINEPGEEDLPQIDE